MNSTTTKIGSGNTGSIARRTPGVGAVLSSNTDLSEQPAKQSEMIGTGLEKKRSQPPATRGCKKRNDTESSIPSHKPQVFKLL